MMFQYPYIGYPSYYQRNYFNHNNHKNESIRTSQYLEQQHSIKNNIEKNSFTTLSHDRNEKMQNSKNNSNTKNIKDKLGTVECLELFGLKLHFDDILLILLIYSLYTEGVDDFYLFIILILLLLS